MFIIFGKLYGVGVGPGDPELLTIKAVNIIKKCDVIAVPNSGGKEQLALKIASAYLDNKTILYCDLPMTHNVSKLEISRVQTADKICDILHSKTNIAFLTLGDPSVYATYSYIHRLVVAKGYEAEIIPGITSFCAAAAALGEPLCENDKPLLILPASDANLEENLKFAGTKVLMKLGKQRKKTIEILNRLNLLEKSAIVERCTLDNQTITKKISEDDDGEGYFSMIIIKEDGIW